MDAQASESVRLIATVDAVWSAIRAAHPDVPAVLLMTAPSCGDRRAIGHFWPMKWQHRTEGDLHEVILFAEYLNRTPAEVFGTLLHEAVHACNFVRKVKDCSASQYHNAEFRKTAHELGLKVKQMAPYGWARTELTEETEKRWAEQIEQLGKGIQVFRRTSQGKSVGVQTPKTRNLRASCACGFLIRVSKATIERTEIKCGSCGSPFAVG